VSACGRGASADCSPRSAVRIPMRGEIHEICLSGSEEEKTKFYRNLSHTIRNYGLEISYGSHSKLLDTPSAVAVVGLSNIDAYVSPPTHRDLEPGLALAGTGMSRSPGCRLCSLMNRQSTNATKFTEITVGKHVHVFFPRHSDRERQLSWLPTEPADERRAGTAGRAGTRGRAWRWSC